LRDNAVWETLSEKELSPEDRNAGVQRDLIVRLGSKTKQDELSTPVRIIEIHHVDPLPSVIPK
jgi:hypothetical protein